MEGLNIIKKSLSAVTGIGVEKILKNAILYTMPPETKFVSKVCIMVAHGVISWMVTDKTDEFIDKKVDEVYEEVVDVVRTVKGE